MGAADGVRKTLKYERLPAGCKLTVQLPAGAVTDGQHGTLRRFCKLRKDATHVRGGQDERASHATCCPPAN